MRGSQLFVACIRRFVACILLKEEKGVRDGVGPEVVLAQWWPCCILNAGQIRNESPLHLISQLPTNSADPRFGPCFPLVHVLKLLLKGGYKKVWSASRAYFRKSPYVHMLVYNMHNPLKTTLMSIMYFYITWYLIITCGCDWNALNSFSEYWKVFNRKVFTSLKGML